MRERWPGRWLVALGLLAALCLAAVPARAYHTKEEHLVEYSAYNLRSGDVRLGIWDAAWGPWGWVTLQTYIWPWFLKVSNVSAKFRLWSSEDWCFSGRLGMAKLDAEKWGAENPAVFKVFPIELMSSYALSTNWTISAGIIYTGIVVEGSNEEDLKGAAGVSNTQLVTGFEYRMSERWAFLIRTRHLLKIDASAKADITIQIDEYSQATIRAAGGTEDVGGMKFPDIFSVVPALAYSRETFNLVFGLGYGNFNVPGINFLAPARSFVPEFDMFWKF